MTRGKPKAGKYEFSSWAREALDAARQLADAHQLPLAPAHLFLALLDQGEITSYLTQNGIDLAEARLYAEAALPESPVDDRAMAKVLEYAAYEAWRELGTEIRTRHLLVGLLRQQKWSDLPPVLESLGLNLGELRNQFQAARRGKQKFATGHPLNQANGEAQKALDAAEAAMRGTYCGRINTAHLLLGLLNSGPNEAVAALERAGVDLAPLRERAQKAIHQDGEVAGAERRFTPAAQRALDRARDLAERGGQPHWGTGRLLEALLPRPVSLKEAAREKLHYRGELDDPAAAVLEPLQLDFTPPAEGTTPVSYTEGFQKAWAAAHVIARNEGATSLTPHHLWGGLVANPESLAFEALQQSGVNLEIWQSRVPPDWAQQLKEAEERQEQWHIPLTPAAKQIVELSAQAAQAANFSHVGVEQLLFVLIKVGEVQENPDLQRIFQGGDMQAAVAFLEPHVLRSSSQVPPARTPWVRWTMASVLSFTVSFIVTAGDILLVYRGQFDQSLASICYSVFFLQLGLTIAASIYGLVSKSPSHRQVGKAYLAGFLFGTVCGLILLIVLVVTKFI